MQINISSNIAQMQKRLNDLAKKQLPFATARALSDLAKQVQVAETAALPKVLDRPTPFTMKAIGTVSANKYNLVAKVYMRDITAAYLEPYEFSGPHMLNKGNKALLVPVMSKTNQYGNLPRSRLKTLLAKPNVFIGTIKFGKSGQTISGVWQRPTVGVRRDGRKGTKGNTMTGNTRAGMQTGLKLLIRFEDNEPVKQRLHYMDRAKKIIKVGFYPAIEKALKQAMATAR